MGIFKFMILKPEFVCFWRAAELMTRTGPVVTLEVAKQGAIFNGVSDLLNKPSPTMQRGIYFILL